VSSLVSRRFLGKLCLPRILWTFLSCCACLLAVDESYDYIHFLVPYEHEDRLPFMLAHLKVRCCLNCVQYIALLFIKHQLFAESCKRSLCRRRPNATNASGRSLPQRHTEGWAWTCRGQWARIYYKLLKRNHSANFLLNCVPGWGPIRDSRSHWRKYCYSSPHWSRVHSIAE